MIFVRKYALNKGYALIDVLTTPTCMVMVARVGSGNETSNCEHAKNTRSGGSYKIKKTKLKISMMMSVGDLHKSVISFHSGVDHIYLAHALNKPCSRIGRKYALNK